MASSRPKAPKITIQTSPGLLAPGRADDVHSQSTSDNNCASGASSSNGHNESSASTNANNSSRAITSSDREHPDSPLREVGSSSSGFASNDDNFLSVINNASCSSPTAPSLSGETLRSRSTSLLSVNADQSLTVAGRSRTNSDFQPQRARFDGDDLSPDEALCPESNDLSALDIELENGTRNNPFAFTPSQLARFLNPKSLAAFRACGGIVGLEKGLQTDTVAGLSVDETSLATSVTIAEARQAATQGKTSFNRPILDDPVLDRGRGIGRSHTGHSDVVSSDVQNGGNGRFHERKSIFRDNRVPTKKAVSIWRLFWNVANDKVLIILTVAAVVSLALGIYEAVGQEPDPGEGPSLDWVEGVAIEVAVLIVILVNGLNDYRREKQFAALNARKEDRQVKAIRSGKSVLISVFDVMVGDVIHLESGDSVPADGILISGNGIKCDESSLTGESDAMKKTAGKDVWQHMQNGTATSKLDPFIISGSKVLEGVGTYLVTAVGVHSSFGKVMMSMQTEVEETPLQIKLGRMASWIGYLGTAAAGLLFVILLIRFLAGLPGNPVTAAKKGSMFLDILIVAITIIVVAVPEGLPVAVTLALSFATKKMLKENNLVRHLRACETMGNATTICSDKTGTLTQNKMSVVAGLVGTNYRFHRGQQGDNEEDKLFGYASFFSRASSNVQSLILQSCAINSTAFEGEEAGMFTFIGSKTETAILTMARDHLGMGPVAEERAGVDIVQLFPFDSNRKCMGAVMRLASGTYRMLIKGAAEILLDRAELVLLDPFANALRTEELTPESRETIGQIIEDFASQSLRTIAFLYQDFQQWPPLGVKAESDDKSQLEFDLVFRDMIFLGVVGIQDPLRDGVSAAVRTCQNAGVVVRMVTGDNAVTARAIATDCGIMTPGGVIMEGPKFRQLPGPEMDQVLPHLQVLARSSPEDKRILVARLKGLGETVAVTGDGTNDGPALKLSDVGFSMGLSGTEVAKEASAIILMDDNFSSIVKAIMWGRCVNDAVAKFLQFQITVNITAVVLAFVSAVSSPQMRSVLSAVQLLWVNLIMDTFAALALATDPPTEKILDRAPTPKRAPLITTNMWKMIIGQAFYQLVVTFVLYFAGSSILNYDTRNRDLQLELNTIVFNTFVWMQIFNQFNNRRLDNHLNVFEGVHRNIFFIAISITMIAGQVMIIFVGGASFEIKRINGVQWAICILCAAPCLLWAMILRCIPDRYAAVVFAFAAKTWASIYHPIARLLAIIFRPIKSPVARMFRRLRKTLCRTVCKMLRRPYVESRGKTKTSTTSDSSASFAEEDEEQRTKKGAELARMSVRRFQKSSTNVRDLDDTTADHDTVARPFTASSGQSDASDLHTAGGEGSAVRSSLSRPRAGASVKSDDGNRSRAGTDHSQKISDSCVVRSTTNAAASTNANSNQAVAPSSTTSSQLPTPNVTVTVSPPSATSVPPLPPITLTAPES